MIVQHMIVPRISISQALDDWHKIRNQLKENNRERKLQSEVLSRFI